MTLRNINQLVLSALLVVCTHSIGLRGSRSFIGDEWYMYMYMYMYSSCHVTVWRKSQATAEFVSVSLSA